jgi:hypothetical protein
MSEEQKEKNRKIKHIRRYIEFALGTTKLTCDCLFDSGDMGVPCNETSLEKKKIQFLG